MHTHLKFVFKWDLLFSTLARTRCSGGTMLFQAAATLQASLLSNVSSPMQHTHF